MADVARERGAANVTVADLVARSGVSRRTFYDQFADREECLLAAFDDAVRRIEGRVVVPYQAQGRWSERIRAALVALLVFLDEQPALGDLVFVQALVAGPAVLERRQRILAHVVAAVDEGRSESKTGAGPPPLTAEGTVGAVFAVIHSRLVQPRHSPLIELAGELMSMIVLPYFGAAAARAEQQRVASEIARAAPWSNGLSALRELEMRLTYRTMRVLLAIGAHPGASNRRVADEAGVSDQGQISKLLVRLQKLGLIENAGDQRFKGKSNTWTLTERGAAVREAISAQTPQL